MTSQPQYIELDWEAHFEPLFGSPIVLQPNTLLWRGYDTQYPAIPERYAYYSSYEIANEYAKLANRELGCFATTRPLKLLDIRFMKTILSRIIQSNIHDDHTNDFGSTILSFGLCSFGHQIALVKERYKEELKKNTQEAKVVKAGLEKMMSLYTPNTIVEQEGIRIAETINDGTTLAFLQELFKHLFDGFISPRLVTPFHTYNNGQLAPELILFNPSMCDLNQIYRYPSTIITKSIAHYLKDRHELVDIRMMKTARRISSRFYVGGKKRSKHMHHLDILDDKLNREDEQALQSYTKAKEAGKRWRANISVINPDACTPSIPVSNFTSL
jgi:hypothetical protein